MAQMRIAPGTQHLGACHEVAVVLFNADGTRLDRLPVAGPAAAGFEFFVGPEQFCPATYAAIDAVGMVVPELPGEGTFRSLLAGDLILIW
jgi:hypothetical protein